ncbi:MAG: PP2C family protein-serine/threonine phosphatase [bacterium]|nr:PP2C family protein-serine/threonine phosphatase [bacterium]
METGKILKKALPMILLGCAGIWLFLALNNTFLPHKAIDLQVGKNRAIQLATQFLKKKGYSPTDYDVNAVPEYYNSAFIYLQEEYGLEKAVELFRNEPNCGLNMSWDVIWRKDVPLGTVYERFNVTITGKGGLKSFAHEFPRDVPWPKGRNAHLQQDEALKMANGFLEHQLISLEGFRKKNFNTRKYGTRTDHVFSWEKNFRDGSAITRILVVVQGDEVGRLQTVFGVPTAKSIRITRAQGNSQIAVIVSFVFIFLFCLAAVAVFLRKYHEGEVGVRSATIFFFLLWFLLAGESSFKFYVTSYNMTLGNISHNMVALIMYVLLLFIVWPFQAILGFVSWSVGEALGRERFHWKFVAVDSILSRRFATINVAYSLMNGYLAGFGGLGLIALGASGAVAFGGAKIAIGGYTGLMAASLPVMVPLLSALSTGVLSELVFRLFGNLFLYKYLRSKWVGLFISSGLWTLFAISSWGVQFSLYPMIWEWGIYYLCGLYLGYLFWKFDLLTVITANFIMVGIMQVLPLLSSTAPEHAWQGPAVLIFLFLPVLLIIKGFIKKDVFSFVPELIPAHIKRITERVRMAKELEIARQVQQRLLPAKCPEFEGVEVDGVCIPATEVGGDYYDFIPLDESRLGLVIGDVSGKGVPAAIYMTLTKGILQAQAENRSSPEEVLSRLNHTLYDMMDHKSFVTLCYAVIDVKNKTLDFSRAGHNPLLYFSGSKSDVQSLKPRGIALGLDEGAVFNNVIGEGHLELKKGDLLVFYTDGFSEAMDKNQKEYGEKRMAALINANKSLPLREIIDLVVRDVGAFAKGCPQHDDMTMVLARMY